MGYDLSEEGRKLAEQYQLGIFRETYTAQVSRLNIGILVLVAICMCIIELISFVISYDSSVFWLFLFITSFFLLMIPCYLIPSFLYRDLRVHVCTDGFIRIRGNEMYARRWDQIASVWVKGFYFGDVVAIGCAIVWRPVPLQRRTGIDSIIEWYKVNARDGTSVEFGSVLRNSLGILLGETIALEVWRTQQRDDLHLELSRALSDCSASIPLCLGKLTISTEGIMKGTKILPWSQLGKVGHNGEGILWIRERDKWRPWARMPCDIKNALLFVTLVEELKKVKQGTAHGTR
jgi:hypothetical protein